MSIQTEGNRTYASINDLPGIEEIKSGDKFLIQATSGTSTLDFRNFLISLDNTTFKEQFNEMLEGYSISGNISEIVGNSIINVQNLQSEKENLTDAVNQLNVNDIANFDTLAISLNKIINLINANTDQFPNRPIGITLPLEIIALKG